ncbi:hypothetical protein F511_34835 [Dorcoceras hygrometricum]|uniref:Uncharacterized protein n=1 Tax=Dorcoceras hygrometricum TaxID=472368 RepID=A0A2Z7CQJ1_9LAMI|nr:hypothetical protein F511_34835 [Dorcoceras hygrometricum]
MQMLCMKNGITAEGYNQIREPKNSNIAQRNLQRICGHGVCRTYGRYPLTPTRTPLPDASTAQPARCPTYELWDVNTESQTGSYTQPAIILPSQLNRKLKSKPKVRSYQLIKALPEIANAQLLLLLRDPTSSLPQLPKVVSIERATIKECSATVFVQNRDGKRQESTEKSYGEQCLGFATENDDRGKYSKYGISCQI